MRILVTGISGYVGSALVPRLAADGHDLRGFARSAARVTAGVDDLVEGDVITGAGLDAALDGIDVAYYLIHSMERAGNGSFGSLEQRGAERFAEAARAAGVGRIVYLGGLVPDGDLALSRHLGSRMAVEQVLLEAVPGSIAFRASIVIAAASRSFRFLVRLVERLPVLAIPAWQRYRTQPIDGRDVTEFLARAATAPPAVAGSWDVGGHDVMTYGEMIERIAEHMLVARPSLRLGFSVTPVASVVAAAVAGEDPALIGPLMESLGSDLLVRGDDAAAAFGVRLHSFDAAVERSLRDWEASETVRAR